MSDLVNVEKFKEKASLLLEGFATKGLRPYGRKVGVPITTKLKKEEMILEIIAVLCGEKAPEFTSRGAPRKNQFIPPELIATMDELIRVYLRGEAPTQPTIPTPVEEEKKETEKPYYTITVHKGNGEKVMSLGTSLDFQIILSNQPPITKQNVEKETSEN